jgi:ankyrin repeat protein/CHAT domain-containing protein
MEKWLFSGRRIRICLAIFVVGLMMAVGSATAQPFSRSETRQTAPLIQAIESGNYARVNALLSKRANPNQRDSWGETALILAIRKGYEEIATLLIQRGADANAPNSWSVTPLQEAIKQNLPSLPARLLAAGARVNQVGVPPNFPYWGGTRLRLDDFINTGVAPPLVLAAYRSRRALIPILLEKGANPNPPPLLPGHSFTPPLYYLAEQGDTANLKLLLRKGANPNARSQSGSTPLMAAALHGHTEIVRLLLDANADPNAKEERDSEPSAEETTEPEAPQPSDDLEEEFDPFFGINRGVAERKAAPAPQKTVLLVALFAPKPQIAVIRLLLERQADPNAADTSGVTPLFLATQKGRADLIQLLLDKGAQMPVLSSDDGRSRRIALLRAAIDANSPPCAALLLNGMTSEAFANKGQVLLLDAVRKSNAEIVKMLLKYQIDPNPVLNTAVTEGSVPVVEALLQAGANPATHTSTKVEYDTDEGKKIFVEGSILWDIKDLSETALVKMLAVEGINLNEPSKKFGALTLLHCAAQKGALDTVEYLLSKGAAVDAKTTWGDTPLMFAAENGHLDTVLALLKANADVNVQTVKSDLLSTVRFNEWKRYGGETAALLAAREGHGSVVMALLQRGADVNARDARGQTLLMAAATRGLPPAVQFLIRQGVKLDERWSTVRANQDTEATALTLAIHAGAVESVEALLDAGANPNPQTQTDLSPLLLAIEQHRRKDNEAVAYRMVATLLAHGARPDGSPDRMLEDTNNPNRRTSQPPPLFEAVRQGAIDLVKLLLEHLPNANIQNDKGETALHWVLKGYDIEKYADMVRLLLLHHVNPNTADKSGATPLLDALRTDRVEVVGLLQNYDTGPAFGHYPALLAAARHGYAVKSIKRLLEQGANPNVRDKEGNTPLLFAVERDAEATKLLLAAGADPNVKTARGETILLLAVSKPENAVNGLLEALLNRGGSLEAVDANGENALLRAARSGSSLTVEMLRHRGARERRNRAGETALHLAARRGDLSIVRAFLHSAENINARSHTQETPLMLAAQGGELQTLALLISKGANPLLKDNQGRTAQDHALAKQQTAAAALLAAARPSGNANPPHSGQVRISSAKPPVALVGPTPEFWNQFTIIEPSSPGKRPGVLWPQANAAEGARVRRLLLDLAQQGWGRNPAHTPLAEFWEQLTPAVKNTLMRRHAALFRAARHRSGTLSDWLTQQVAAQPIPADNQMLPGLDKLFEDFQTDFQARLDAFLQPFTANLTAGIRDLGGGTDSDYVNRMTSDVLKGPVFRAAGLLIARQKSERAWDLVETARSLPYRLQREQREIIANAPAGIRNELRAINVAMISQQANYELGGSIRKQAELALRRSLVERGGLMAEITGGLPSPLPSASSLQAVANALPSGTLSIVFAVGSRKTLIDQDSPAQSYVFLLHRPNDPAFGAKNTPSLIVETLDLSPEDLARAVIEFRSFATHPEMIPVTATPNSPSVQTKGRELFDLLFPNAAGEAVRCAKRLQISPDGPLWDLPFAALVMSDEGKPRFVGLEKPITYIHSLTQFLALRVQRTARPPKPVLLALGDPRYERAAWRQPYPLGDDPPQRLPWTNREVRQIAHLYGVKPQESNRRTGEGVLLLDQQATESNLRRFLPAADMVHLSTHGQIDTARGWNMYGGIWLTPPPREPNAGETQNDGALQAWEIFNQTRLKADLVCISACEMARGQDVDGAGIADMIWAFQAAGARSVVAGQWKVEEESSAKLMVTFHQKLRGGLAKDEALRLAMRDLASRPETAHPYYWSPFLLTGDFENRLFSPSARP